MRFEPRRTVEHISPGQFIWLSAALTIAGSIYLWPARGVALAGTDLSYAAVLAWGGAALLARFAVRHVPGFTPPRLYHRLGLMVWALEFVAVTSASAELFSLLLTSYFFPLTPPLVFSGLLIGIGTWLGSRPLSALARTTQFWVPLLLASAAIAGASLLVSPPWLATALPSTTVALGPVGEGALACWFLWISGEAYAFFGAHLRAPQSGPRLVTAALAIQGGVVMLFYVVVLSNLGPYAAARLQWPIVFMTNNIQFSGFVVSSLGSVMVMTWTTALLIFLSVHFRTLGSRLASTWVLPDAASARVVYVLGGVSFLLLVLVPWSRWSVSSIMVDWLGPLDLLRILIFVLPLGLRRLVSSRKGVPA